MTISSYIIPPFLAIQQANYLSMPASDTLVVIPVHNEATALPGVIKELQSYPHMDVLVVDDASSDGSLEIALAYNVRALPLCLKLGAWGAMQAGLRYAARHGYRQVITMDGDGQHHSHEIPNLCEALRRNPEADLVIGACLYRGSRLRKIAWRFFRRITGIGIEDITSGFRLYNQRAIHELTRKEATLLEYQDVGVLLMLKAAGLKIIEQDVSMTPRRSGKSRIYSSWGMVAYYMVVTTILSISKVKRAAPSGA